MQLSSFIESLAEIGDHDSQGEFTISPEEARRKLQHFQLQDASDYILLMVASAYLGGATYVNVYDSPGELRLEYDGEGYTQDDCAELYSRLLQGRQDHSTVLALALISITSSITLDSRTEAGTVHWTLAGGDSKLVCSDKAGDSLTTITIARARGLRGILARLRGYAGMSDEARKLDSRCEYSTIPITINGAIVNRAVALGKPALLMESRGLRVETLHQATLLQRVSGELVDAEFQLALALGDGPLRVVICGVSYRVNGPSGLTGVVWCDELETDLTKQGVVQNAVWTQLRAELMELHAQAVLFATRNSRELTEPEMLTIFEAVSELADNPEAPDLEIRPEAYLRMLQHLHLRPDKRQLRAHLTLCIADAHRKAGQEATAANFYDKAYEFCKETLRRDGIDLRAVNWAARAVRGLGGDATTLCDWTLFGAAVALEQNMLTVAASWFRQVQVLAASSKRGGTARFTAGSLGRLFCDGLGSEDGRFVSALFEAQRSDWEDLKDLQLTREHAPKEFDRIFIFSLKKLACQYRDDIKHIVDPMGTIDFQEPLLRLE